MTPIGELWNLLNKTNWPDYMKGQSLFWIKGSSWKHLHRNIHSKFPISRN